MKVPRHLLIKDWNQEKISHLKVMIAGLGAIGSQVAVTLARIGVGEIIAVDPDTLEEHNIANQIYTRKHLGMSKVDALGEIVEDIGYSSYKGIKATAQEIIHSKFDVDVYLGCVDNAGTRFFLNFLAVTLDKPYIDAGVEEYKGGVRTVIPRKTPCLLCWPDMIKSDKIRASCSSKLIPFAYFTATYAASLQVMQLVNLAFGKPVQEFIFFDLQKGITSYVIMKRNVQCELCGGIKWKKD